tara:strand:+ start:480 stop:695 length:216 start_codon:yes stop_codon:yes gene_type:complete
MKHSPVSELKGRFDKQTTLKITSQMSASLDKIALFTQQTKASVERQFLRAGIEAFREENEAHERILAPYAS